MGGPNSGLKPTTRRAFKPGLDPWSRQPDEPEKAWQAFKLYRDLDGPRRLIDVAEKLGKPAGHLTTLEKWSCSWSWRVRVAAYDNHRDRREREAALQVGEKKAKQRVGFAEALWMTGMRGLGLWNDYLKEWADEQDKRAERGVARLQPPISPTEIQRLVSTGANLVLLLEGRPTEIGEQRYQLSVDDRRRNIQKLISDKRVRAAMEVVTKAVDEDAGRVH